MRRLTMEEAHSGCVEQLGLDPATFHVTSVEAIAEALRRAAYYFCPLCVGNPSASGC